MMVVGGRHIEVLGVWKRGRCGGEGGVVGEERSRRRPLGLVAERLIIAVELMVPVRLFILFRPVTGTLLPEFL